MWLAGSLEELAASLAQQHKPGQAAQLLGAAEALRERTAQPLSPIERPRVARSGAALRARLQPDALSTQWAIGRAMAPEEAVRLALGTESLPAPALEHAPAQPPNDATSALTRREREVASLVARGFSNRRIADALVIAESTATVHVKHILAKLEFVSRAQVAAWAVSCGLLDQVAAD